MRLWPPAALAIAAALVTGCVETRPKAFVDASTPPAPEKLMSAPMPPAPPATAPGAEAPELPPAGGAPRTISPAEAVGVALRNNPATRQAWFQARAAAAAVGSKRSAYYPTIELDGSYLRQKIAAFNGQTVYYQTTYGPGAILSWLLLDFGGRTADVAEAEALLAQANAVHDAVLNDV
ncbi:MAG TPA: TolC family protein, partial [Thermoanaerobaculia bacterium]|nr:TolC family protein [Thermoanaerobaculia bacterium]